MVGMQVGPPWGPQTVFSHLPFSNTVQPFHGLGAMLMTLVLSLVPSLPPQWRGRRAKAAVQCELVLWLMARARAEGPRGGS